MATALSDAWTIAPEQEFGGTRGFWTKRKRTATSLVAVLSLLIGIAIAFKLFEQEVPNNVVRDSSNFDYAVEVFRPDDPDPSDWLAVGPTRPIYPLGTQAIPGGPASNDQFPGDRRSEHVRIRNTNDPPRDASFSAYIDQSSIEVSCGVIGSWSNCGTASFTVGPGNVAVVNPTDSQWSQFVGFYTFSVDKEKVLNALGLELNENDHGLSSPPPALDDHDASGNSQTVRVCEGALRTITPQNACPLGTVREMGTSELGLSGTLQPTDIRWYTFGLVEADSGDQTKYAGWTVTFTLVFQARVPADADPTDLLYER